MPLIPWAVAGGAVIALLGVVLYVSRSGGPPQSAATAPVAPFAQGAGAPSSGTATDISNMTPRERADRLFERMMRAQERGDTAEMRFFRPMTLQAYAMLGTLDSDARYHLGLIYALTGEPNAARAQADSLQQADPTNLLIPVLRQQVAQMQGDTRATQQAYRDFLKNYEREIMANKPEYEAHKPILEAFRTEALRAVGQSAPGS